MLMNKVGPTPTVRKTPNGGKKKPSSKRMMFMIFCECFNFVVTANVQDFGVKDAT
ncbi:hypothetical protein DSM107003_10870 [Trichormus variabilis SAG 1403-4b]|uniref:Uncharacterized protein n=1 Tax=Trichormus variabilis SAG 1403-4b TaxID=447716 RepID=A0A3S1CCE2_ANAVA|nr:hypothetical protein DSM107003_10870 [Trichormus variabilis SAG 1403-4b]